MIFAAAEAIATTAKVDKYDRSTVEAHLPPCGSPPRYLNNRFLNGARSRPIGAEWMKGRIS